ncbi:MAG TPA: UDP-N-acetylmuramoyl-L-alanyl-D-glutamate--2,6-diaminopimelate ligase [Bacteroidota bacterium]
MQLSKLLEGVRVIKLYQTMFGRMVVTHEVEVRALQYDSRKIEQSDCFVALRGAAMDGHRFIGEAVNKGAKVVVIQDETVYPDSLAMHNGVVKIVVSDTRVALAEMAANFYGHPARKLAVVGVTGTNGKTTTTHLVKSILEAHGHKAGLIGTIEYKIGEKTLPAIHTTPESLELQGLLRQMVDKDCTSVSMEVSSHALQQSRVHGVDFRVAAFTNLTQDHLDYHGSMDEYFRAKKLLFDGLGDDRAAVTNADDGYGNRIAGSTKAKTFSYAINAAADIRATNINMSVEGSKMIAEHAGEKTDISSPLVGRFNVYNVLTAFSVGVALGVPKQTIQKGIASLRSVKGRFERVASPKGWTAIIDYAHTPDALEKCLRAIREVIPNGRIITVFGAGGDRDTSKRPLMGKIAGELSDMAIVTSDNPRTEDPQRIVEDVAAGIPKNAHLLKEVDRRAAIHKAVELARPGDVVLIAGKGHEEYQVVGTVKRHFSDREVVEELL